jgi:hypothetical protein
MFSLADMMTHVEVGESMARLAIEKPDDLTLATARVFSNACARLVAEKARLIALGSTAVDAGDADNFMKSTDFPVLENSYCGLIDDMDHIADRVFERTS